MIKVFDRKGDFSALTTFPGFVYWRLKDFADNWIAPPPGVSFRRWVAIFAEILGNFLDIRIAARGLLVSEALKLHKKRQAAGITLYPTIRDIFISLLNTKYPMISNLSRYRETLTNRLEGLQSDLGDQICSQKIVAWNRFLDTDWALSLIGLPTDRQNLFITVTVAKILTYRMVNNLRSSHLVDLFVFDEASTVFTKWHERHEGTYILLDLLAKSREFGGGFIIASQTCSNLPSSLISNMATKVMVGGSGLGSDYDIFAADTGMTREQKEFTKQRTQPGQACGKDPRYPHPFTLEVPRIA